MKVVCVKRGKIKYLTEGKQYQLVQINSGTHKDSSKSYTNFIIVNDIGIEKSYSSTRFLTIQQIREVKLNNIGI